MKKLAALPSLVFVLTVVLLFSCNQNTNKTNEQEANDTTVKVEQNSKDSLAVSDTTEKTVAAKQKTDLPKVLVYNFHVTNRCASCIAIEEATTKTLKTYFPSELKQGRIKQYILNVDDEANEKVSEKYQVFGSALIIVRVFKGKEVTTDLTGDGFKYARNKEEKFIEILKNKISEYLK